MKNALLLSWVLWLCPLLHARAADELRITVDINAAAGYHSIQEALNSIPAHTGKPVVIFIKKGVYKESVFIEKNNITLEGEDRDKTIITVATARDEWRCTHNDDWGAAALNIKSDDITLRNLTVVNSYGFDEQQDKTVYCAADTPAHRKVVRRTGHQMALRTTTATRVKAVNCHFKAFGGDTVSAWNVEAGKFYFKHCTMEGGVDFYCPRGWSYAEDCRFIAHCGDASIWHDGSAAEDSKTVLKNCSFEGFNGFMLGRYHKDAQFFLVNCSFAQNMADKAIYKVPTTNVIRWGERIYYYNCHRTGGDYKWFADNLQTASGKPEASEINARWTFNGTWDVTEK